MTSYDDLQKQTEQKYGAKDKKKEPKMRQTGKQIFKLQNLIIKKKHDRLSSRKNP